MDFVALPPHCAFCLQPLPDESVTCRRCETPYCSAECRNVRQFEERVLGALESERPAKRARTLRLRDDDTRWDHQEEEARRAAKRSWATTRAAARNEERRRHFSAVTTLKQIRLRMQEHREEQQRPRSRCVVS